MLGRVGSLVVVVMVVACGGKGSVTPRDAQANGADGFCCPIAPQPTCDCADLGGRAPPDGWCPWLCDALPVGWVLAKDDAGCPVWFPNYDGCPWPEPDAGNDGPPDATSEDGPADGRAD